MNSEDTRNLFLAIALSVLVMAGWQYFFAGPIAQRQHQAQTQSQANVTPPPARPAAAPAPGGAAPARVEEPLKRTPRVASDTRSLGGSIDLKGGKLDDLVLK